MISDGEYPFPIVCALSTRGSGDAAPAVGLTYIAVWLQRDAVQAGELQQMVASMASAEDGTIDLHVDSVAYRSVGAQSLSGTLQSLSGAVGQVRSNAVLTDELLRNITGITSQVRQGVGRQASMVVGAEHAVDTILANSRAGRQRVFGGGW